MYWFKQNWKPLIFRLFAILFVFVGLLWSSNAWTKPASALPIDKVEIQGNRKIESAAVLQKLKSVKGSLFSSDVVREDIRAIFALGFFEQVEAIEESISGGIKLVFKVKEKPIVVKIEYEGLEALDKDDIKDQIQIKEYEVLDLQKLKSSVEKLQSKYEEKGYYLADVRFLTQIDEKKNEATVTFHIDENDKIQVKKINIIGNKLLPTDELKSVMQTKEGGAFSWMSGSGSYREAVFERDIGAMGFYYGTLGYVRARFGKPEVSVSPDKKWIYITFFVDEGSQYSVGKVDFSGDLLYSRDDLVNESKLISGEIFNTETLRRETLKYSEKYSDLGYAFANVVPSPNIHDDTKLVDVTYEIERGERVYIGKITVTSNTRSKDKVIRRELLIQEGELFNGAKKRISRENVVRLGFFDSVEFHQSTSKTSPNVVDIEVKVKERSTGQLVIGAGYATGGQGFIANAQLSQNNFLGNGQIASLTATMQTGQSRYQANLSFQEPYVGSSLWSLGGDIYQTRREVGVFSTVNTFEEVRSGTEIKLGHPVLEYTNLFLSYKFEHAYVPGSSIIDQNIIPSRSVNGFTSSVTSSLIFDKRDDRYEPREGHYWSLAAEYAGIGGDRYFLKSTANFKYFHPIFWDFIFRFNVQAGNISATRAGYQIPVNERFVLGGLYSLRGYDFSTIGPDAVIGQGSPSDLSIPARTLPANTRIVIGGHNQAYSNAEIEFPILKEARLKGVLFFDIGNAWDDLKSTNPKVYANFGWGFRWFTPIGPLRFEFGYPIVNGGSTKFQFTIGPPF